MLRVIVKELNTVWLTWVLLASFNAPYEWK